MLRVTMSVSAEGATKYFDAALSTSDYYASEHGVWGGKCAERLGLVGDVRREDFVSLASNKTPGTKKETLTVRTKDKRTAGYDFCFSVPKSVSIYLAEALVPEAARPLLPNTHHQAEARSRRLLAIDLRYVGAQNETRFEPSRNLLQMPRHARGELNSIPALHPPACAPLAHVFDAGEEVRLIEEALIHPTSKQRLDLALKTRLRRYCFVVINVS